MDSNILICYKSVTGFTKRYAEMIAKEAGGTLMALEDVTPEALKPCDIVVFGGRFHAGAVDGLKRMKALLAKGRTQTFIVFATGAMPITAAETIRQAWEGNFTAQELRQIPHFYLPGGLRYEKMPLHERAMMRAFAAVMKGKINRKKEKTAQDEAFVQMIGTSYDLSAEQYIEPLVSCLKEKTGARG